MIFYKGMSPFFLQSPKDGRFLNRGLDFYFKVADKIWSLRTNFSMAATTNETLWISFFKGQQLKFEGSFSSHLFLGGGGGGGGCRIKSGKTKKV